ncbi:hypothetical protein DID76_04620 [Candidatus Marinamargulisbacteria bacterium SCGC AG-414-C22]|nr:hypothetical protein DID76_04620 [Candidatus Marinamargulisbacteria bacterium SCGC AG-414-C22]
MALRKLGFKPDIYEKTSSIQPVGYGISLLFNAVEALSRLGLKDELYKKGIPITAFNFFSNKGTSLTHSDLSVFEEKYNVQALGIKRSDLHHILINNLPKESIYLNHELEGIIEGDESADLIFKGNKTIKADVVVGADGIHSNVRNHIFGKNNLRDSGQLCWRGIAPFPKNNIQSFESWGTGKRFGALQIAEREVYWYASINQKQLKNNNKCKKDLLIKLFSGWHSPIQEIINNTNSAAILETKIVDAKPTTKWHQGNTVLLGDSIHPTTPNLGQGAGMAIESAYILADCFIKKNNLKSAFIKYEKERQQRTAWITNQSWQFGKISQLENSFICTLRNSLVKLSSILPNKIKNRGMYQLCDPFFEMV